MTTICPYIKPPTSVLKSSLVYRWHAALNLALLSTARHTYTLFQEPVRPYQGVQDAPNTIAQALLASMCQKGGFPEGDLIRG
jgi:hypothetical protein